MHLAVGGECGFAGCQVHQVHDECDEQTAVTGVLAGNNLHELSCVSDACVFGAGQL